MALKVTVVPLQRCALLLSVIVVFLICCLAFEITLCVYVFLFSLSHFCGEEDIDLIVNISN